MYRIFFDKEKYCWRGPNLRQVLKLTCPLRPLKMNADDMYWMKPKQLAFWPKFVACCVDYFCLVFSKALVSGDVC